MPYVSKEKLAELEKGVRPERKPAPNVSIVEEVYKDPRKERVARAWRELAKENGWDSEQIAKAKAEQHLYFSRGDADKDTMEAEGYAPFMVSDGKEQKQVRDRGDLLWTLPMDVYKEKAEAPGRLAVQMLGQSMVGKSDGVHRGTEIDTNPA